MFSYVHALLSRNKSNYLFSWLIKTKGDFVSFFDLEEKIIIICIIWISKQDGKRALIDSSTDHRTDFYPIKLSYSRDDKRILINFYVFTI